MYSWSGFANTNDDDPTLDCDEHFATLDEAVISASAWIVNQPFGRADVYELHGSTAFVVRCVTPGLIETIVPPPPQKKSLVARSKARLEAWVTRPPQLYFVSLLLAAGCLWMAISPTKTARHPVGATRVVGIVGTVFFGLALIAVCVDRLTKRRSTARARKKAMT